MNKFSVFILLFNNYDKPRFPINAEEYSQNVDLLNLLSGQKYFNRYKVFT